ncbi:glycoside hydrolase family 76 protein [Pseudopedobacter beijingensis]|uniref:Glycoside hydrolase family 76 protein n=1 Tax=Pseudopedobacter beijingensis TaxID=1207056 RepID=A0ABW4IEN5_9SPHI
MKILLYLSSLILITNVSSCKKVNDEYSYTDTTISYKKADWLEVSDKGTLGLLQFWYPVTNANGQEGGYFGHGSNGANPGFNYWLQAQALDVLVDAYNRTTLLSERVLYKNYIDKWYIGVQAKHNSTGNADDVRNFEDNYVDDMEWIGLAALRAYQATGDHKFYVLTQHMWESIFLDLRGYNESAPYYGGIFWLRSASGKNACSNGPGSLLCMKLYEHTGDEKYLTYAEKVYDWLRNNLFNSSTGAVYDNVVINAEGVANVQKVALSYNQGTFLGTALELYKVTGRQMYLDDAKLSANYTIGRKVKPESRVLQAEGEEQNQVFRGIFIRSFLELTRYEKLDEKSRSTYVDAMERFGQYIWQAGSATYNIDANNTCLMFSNVWDESPVSYEFSQQMTGCMLVDAVNQLNTAGFIKQSY